MKKYIGRALVVPLLGAFCQISQAADDTDPLQFGRLRFGMSVDEVRAAQPDTPWTVTDQNAKGRAYAIEGERAVTIAGIAFNLATGSRHVGISIWELEASEATANATACQDRGVQVVTELERRFGTFAHPGNVITGEAVIRVGSSSQAKISAAEKLRVLDPIQISRKDPGSFWLGADHDADKAGDISVQARARYERDENRSCRITVEMNRTERARPELQMTFDEARLVSRPTIAYRKSSLRAIGVPEKPVKVVVSCRIIAGTGKIIACLGDPSDAPADPYRTLATAWALKYQLRPTNPDADDMRVFDIDVPVTMGPNDIPAFDVSTGARLNTALVRVVRGHQVNPDDFYPDEMRKQQIGGDITILCKVQEDGSVLCDIKPGTTSPAQALTDAAIQIGERLEVRTALSDGNSAVGGLIERRIKFVPPKTED